MSWEGNEYALEGHIHYALEGRWRGANMPWRGEVLYWYLLMRVYTRVYMFYFVHLSSLVRIEPKLHLNDSPTYTTLPCQPRAWERAWERESNTRIACLASVRHTGTYA